MVLSCLLLLGLGLGLLGHHHPYCRAWLQSQGWPGLGLGPLAQPPQGNAKTARGQAPAQGKQQPNKRKWP